MAGFATICFVLFLSDEFAEPVLPLAGDSISRRSNIFWFSSSSTNTQAVSMRRRESGASSWRPNSRACGVSTFAADLSNISQKSWSVYFLSYGLEFCLQRLSWMAISARIVRLNFDRSCRCCGCSWNKACIAFTCFEMSWPYMFLIKHAKAMEPCILVIWIYRACSAVVIALRFGTQDPGFEPSLFHKACYMPLHGCWMKLRLFL